MFGDFVKMTLDSSLESLIVTRDESFGKKCDSGRVFTLTTFPRDSSHAITVYKSELTFDPAMHFGWT